MAKNARLSGHKRTLTAIFAAIVISVGLYIVAQGLLTAFASA
jgi:hypothetical protein